jgi:hypothetical protein
VNATRSLITATTCLVSGSVACHPSGRWRTVDQIFRMRSRCAGHSGLCMTWSSRFFPGLGLGATSIASPTPTRETATMIGKGPALSHESAFRELMSLSSVGLGAGRGSPFGLSARLGEQSRLGLDEDAAAGQRLSLARTFGMLFCVRGRSMARSRARREPPTSPKTVRICW